MQHAIHTECEALPLGANMVTAKYVTTQQPTQSQQAYASDDIPGACVPTNPTEGNKGRGINKQELTVKKITAADVTNAV